MSNETPLVLKNSRVSGLTYIDNLSLPQNLEASGNVVVRGRALPGWGVPQGDRCAGSWSLRTPAAIEYWRSVCWSSDLGLFCAVAETGTSRVMTSPTDRGWSLSATGVPNNGWCSVCWSPKLQLFCAVAYTGPATVNRVMTSPNGTNWTERSFTNPLNGVCWSPDLSMFCAVGGSTVATSTDGITWASSPVPAGSAGWNAVCWAPELGRFCAVTNGAGQGTNRVMTSEDGINWTIRTSPTDASWNSVCWAPEISLFCAVNNDGVTNAVMTSPDGIAWTSRTCVANAWTNICWAPEIGLFCSIAQSGTNNRVMTSPNGTTWTTRTSAANNNWIGLCWAPELGLFCATSVNNNLMCSLPADPYSVSPVYFSVVNTSLFGANGFLNAAVSPLNQLLRSTSSLRYKTNIETLDSAIADKVLQLRPVWYRSLADADRKEWSWYGLIAEEVAAVEPRLVHWTNSEPEYETVTLDDGTTETRETKPRQLIPDGVQYDRLGVLMLNVVKRQKDKLNELSSRLALLGG